MHLRYSSGQTTTIQEYGRDTIVGDNFSCTGTETSLNKCSHAEWGVHNCNHYYDIALKCYKSASKFDMIV